MPDFTTKRCSHCKQEYPATPEYFGRYKSTPDGLFFWCRKCKNEHDKQYRSSEKGKATRSKNRKTERSLLSQRVRLQRFSKTEKGRALASKSAKQARENHPERYRARKEVYKAVQRKEIPPARTLFCANCGLPAHHYHHFKGYEPIHWFDIKPLCRKCHTREHKTT